MIASLFSFVVYFFDGEYSTKGNQNTTEEEDE